MFALVVVAAFAGLSLLEVQQKRFDDEVKNSVSLNGRVEALAKSAYFFYVAECASGDVTNLVKAKYKTSLESYEVSDFSVRINLTPRPHAQVDLEFHRVNPILMNALIINNGFVSADKLSVTLKYPFNHTSSSSGSYLINQREKNNTELCP